MWPSGRRGRREARKATLSERTEWGGCSLPQAIEHMRREGLDPVLVTSSDGSVVGVLERAAVERSLENTRE